MSVRFHHAEVLVVLWLTGCGVAALPPQQPASADGTPGNSAQLFATGQQAAIRGDTVRAEQYLTMARDRGFSERRILPLLLNACLAGSRLRSALNYSEHYLLQHPRDQNLRYLVAALHMSLGHGDEARTELGHLLRLAPNYAQAHYLLGMLESSYNATRALMHLHRYLQLAPGGKHAEEVRNRIMEMSVPSEIDADTSRQPASAADAADSPAPMGDDVPTSFSRLDASQDPDTDPASERRER